MPYPANTLFVYALLLLLGGAGCTMINPEQKTPEGYNLGKPEKFRVPESLLEISGIAFHNGNPGTVYAIQDEQGKLFWLSWGVKKQQHIKFAKNGDYEDLAIIKNRVIVLKSNGVLYSFPLADTTQEEAAGVQEWTSLLPEGEYEGIWADEASSSIYVLCKHCKGSDPKISIPGYSFRLTDSSLSPAGSFTIDVAQIKATFSRSKRGFRPSALANNPLTHEWFIISAVNHLLVITDSSWKVKNAYHLDGNRFNQPEGLAFDTAGNLYISNEGDHLSEGNILKFPRLKQ